MQCHCTHSSKLFPLNPRVLACITFGYVLLLFLLFSFKEAFLMPFATVSKKIYCEDFLSLYPSPASTISKLNAPTSICYYKVILSWCSRLSLKKINELLVALNAPVKLMIQIVVYQYFHRQEH